MLRLLEATVNWNFSPRGEHEQLEKCKKSSLIKQTVFFIKKIYFLIFSLCLQGKEKADTKIADFIRGDSSSVTWHFNSPPFISLTLRGPPRNIQANCLAISKWPDCSHLPMTSRSLRVPQITQAHFTYSWFNCCSCLFFIVMELNSFLIDKKPKLAISSPTFLININ